MCNSACLGFGRRALTEQDVRGRAILEVGARDVNGSLRDHVSQFQPASYCGVDIEMGPGVDEVCDITGLTQRFGPDRFDVVLSTEVLEHVREWRPAMSNMKRVLRPGGVLLVTTRSHGFPYHGYPYDFWRYEVDDIRAILSDMHIECVESDPVSPGVFVKAHKPHAFVERELDSINLYSIVTHDRRPDVTDSQVLVRRLRHKVRRELARVLPRGVLGAIDRVVSPHS